MFLLLHLRSLEANEKQRKWSLPFKALNFSFPGRFFVQADADLERSRVLKFTYCYIVYCSPTVSSHLLFFFFVIFFSVYLSLSFPESSTSIRSLAHKALISAGQEMKLALPRDSQQDWGTRGEKEEEVHRANEVQ